MSRRTGLVITMLHGWTDGRMDAWMNGMVVLVMVLALMLGLVNMDAWRWEGSFGCGRVAVVMQGWGADDRDGHHCDYDDDEEDEDVDEDVDGDGDGGGDTAADDDDANDDVCHSLRTVTMPTTFLKANSHFFGISSPCLTATLPTQGVNRNCIRGWCKTMTDTILLQRPC